MRYGLDVLGVARFSDLAIREWPDGWACGVFANVFGNVWPALEKLLATGRCPVVRIHAVWADDHVYRPKEHDPIIKREAKRAGALAKKFPDVEVCLSPLCEHNMSLAEANSVFKMIMDVPGTGRIIPINSVYRGALQPHITNEVHGEHQKPESESGAYVYSFDGISTVDSDIERTKQRHADSRIFYLWHPAFNGRLNTNDTTPRAKRKAWPTAELIDSIIYLHRECGAVKLPRNYLWKSHADRHETPPEPRAYKPVLIIPPKVDRCELVADNGQVVAVSSRAQPFNDGRYRYYWTEMGYQIAEKARRIQGHPVVQLRVGKKVAGTLSPAFRGGSFR